jgi:hypothetical protein
MLSPGTREAHRQSRRVRHRHEDTRGSRNASHGAFMHDQPIVDCSFSSDSEEISEIHWISAEECS